MDKQNSSDDAKRSLFEYFVTSENILEDYIGSLSALHAGFLMWARLAPVKTEWLPALAYRTLRDFDFNLFTSFMQSDYVLQVPGLIFKRTLFPYMFSMWWEGGTGVFTNTLVKAVVAQGVEIRTSQLVKKIQQDQDNVLVTTSQGNVIRARYAVIATGPIAASQIKIENRFDSNDLVGVGTPYAGLNILLFYDTCWWQGNAYGFLADSSEADPVLGPAPVLPTACVAAGDNALRTLSTPLLSENHTDEDLINRTAIYIADKYPERRDKILNYKRATVFNWYHHNPNIRTGFAYKPGYLTKHGKFFLKPHHRVYISGSERSIKGMNWMEGAVTSGKTVAQNILQSLSR